MRKAIIGGTGVYEVADNLRQENIVTKYGEVSVDIIEYKGTEIVFLPRHGRGHSVPPHQINYRANMMALKQLEVSHIYATCAVGSCNTDYAPGDVVVMSDFVDFTKARPVTFFEGEEGVGHTDMSEPYCHDLVNRFKEQAEKDQVKISGDAIYVCTEGPRFETAAEIRFYTSNEWDVVGMTNVPEVVLAKELGICYSAIGFITNYCTGLIADEDIDHAGIMGAMAQNKEKVTMVAMEILTDQGLAQDNCKCKAAVMKL
jgi:5'-methylthioadenosine phosphorylase